MVVTLYLSMTLPMFLGGVGEDLPASWKTFASKEGAFSVMMPAPVVEQKKTVKTATGQLHVSLAYADGRNDSLFAVSYSDFPEKDLKSTDVEKRLDNARDGAVSSARGKLRSEMAVMIDGSPGREVIIENDGKVIATMRIYVVGRRLYQVMVMGPGAIAREKTLFLESFRLNK